MKGYSNALGKHRPPKILQNIEMTLNSEDFDILIDLLKRKKFKFQWAT